MNIRGIPMASIVLFVYALVNLVIKYFYPLSYHLLRPYLDGGLIGAMFVYGLYYANIYVGAWVNNRKEEVAK
jgi:hypothetical protein